MDDPRLGEQHRDEADGLEIVRHLVGDADRAVFARLAIDGVEIAVARLGAHPTSVDAHFSGETFVLEHEVIPFLAPVA